MAEEQNQDQNNQQQSNQIPTFNSPKIGMNLDSNPIDLSPMEYSLMLNGNVQNSDGNLLKIQNEPSNLLCSRFRPGFLPIGKLYIPVQKITVFFLVNPLTNQSEIGYITNQVYDDNSDRATPCQDCNNPLVEDTPLEQTIQNEGCTYTTIVNASCLNFNINYPVDAVYEIGVNVDTGLPDCDNVTIFFTDNLNPRRYINIDNWPQQVVGFNPFNCNQPEYNGLLDCNEILIDKNYNNGCVISTNIVQGGQNKAGVYQIAAVYANSNGDPITDYFTVSNPISIWDRTNTITTSTDYISGQAIQYTISNLDTRFLYLNIVIIKTINGVTQQYLIGTFPINSTQYASVYTGSNSAKEIELGLNEVLARKPIYTQTKGLITSNDILFSYNNTQQRVINLQPVVNDLRLQWQTIEVEEGFYANGSNVSNYLSYERDEVYTFGIEFRKSNGYKLPTFLISSQPSSYYTGSFYNNSTPYGSYGGVCSTLPTNNYDVLNIPNCCNSPSGIMPSYAGYCTPPSGCTLNQVWQVYNTATNLGTSCGYNGSILNNTCVTTTQYCTSDPYNDGDSPTPCCPESIVCNGENCPDTGFCYISGSCTPIGTPNLITAAVTNTINLYNTSPTIYQPDWNTYVGPSAPGGSLGISYPPSACGPNCGPPYIGNPQQCCILTPNTYVPTNTNCSSSILIQASYNNQCPLITTAFFAKKLSPSKAPLGDCGTGHSDNQVWFQFVAASTTQAITISMYVEVPITIIAYKDCTSIDASNQVASTNGCGPTPTGCNSKDAYLVLQNLSVGTTYYIVAYTPDPTYSGTIISNGVDYTGMQWNWATICVNTPIAINTCTSTTPATYNQIYSYQTRKLVPALTSPTCELQTYQYGDFSYWQSTALYGNNPDVWGDLCGQPIRHHKFPDCAVSHIHDGPLTSSFGTNNKIYPIGVRLDINQIKAILNSAVTRNLITEQEKNEITGYSIKRGNRRTNRSIQAKGFLTDVWQTPLLQLNSSQGEDANWSPVIQNGQSEIVYYPNYVFNDNSNNPDPFISTQQVVQNGHNNFAPYPLYAPYHSLGNINGRYVFHSPNTSFNQPFLTDGQELKLETAENGFTNGSMNEVLYHAKYILLSKQAYELAEALAQIEILLESALAANSFPNPAILGTALPGVGWAIGFAINEGFGIVTNSGKYTQQWADIFEKLGTPQNPAIYYTGVGKYNNFNPVLNEGLSRKRAAINNSMYLNSGNYQFSENTTTIRFNNYNRESSVYISTDAFDNTNTIIPNLAFKPTSIFGVTDTSKTDLFNTYNTNCSVQANYISQTPNISSYYASIKTYVPDQYGTPDQIKWLDTGHCGIINWKDNLQNTVCDTIFGGDTFINRFAYKEKMPLFTDDRVANKTTSVQTDIFYENLGNIGFPNYYFNSTYDVVTGNVGSAFFGFTPPNTHLLCNQNTFFYQRGTLPLYFYSIPYFICESDYNVDLRYGEDQLAKNFYPYVGDIVNWTQQYQVPIYQDNYYFYNNDYSKQNKENFAYILPFNFANLTDTCQTFHPTRVIYSPQGTQFWLNNLSADFYDFPREDGAITVMKELEELKVLVLQEQSNKIFNAFVTMQTNAGIVQVSSSKGIFQDNKPSQIYSTDLGFAGCQNREIVSTPHGTFYVDTRNPAILSVTRTMYGRNVTNDVLEPKEGKSKVKLWFRQNLPFNIIKDYPTVDIDNAWKYFGIATVWDNKFDRLLITKRDARIRPEFKNQVIYGSDLEFYLVDNLGNKTHIIPTDQRYFENKSFTISYNPTINEFLAYLSYIPNYYNSTESYYQSGYNYPVNNNLNDIGLWSHNLTERSFQVFQGNLYPFILDYVVKTTPQNTILKNIQYSCDFYRYQSDLNWYNKNSITFNKSVIYNNNQSTGILNLVPVEKNNLFQLVSYPQYNVNSTSILVENVTNYWSFNNFNNISLLNGNPMLIFTPNNVAFKEVNPASISYTPKYIPNMMKSDFFNVRLINDMYSNYKIIFKHGLQETVKSI